MYMCSQAFPCNTHIQTKEMLKCERNAWSETLHEVDVGCMCGARNWPGGVAHYSLDIKLSVSITYKI